MAADELRPLRLAGGRFDKAVQGKNDVGFPLDAIDELARYDRLIVAVASALWKEENPGRNLPRNFRESVQLRLTGLEEGSVKSVMSRMAKPGGIGGDQSFGPRARALAASALAAVAVGQAVPEAFPEAALQPLAMFAKGLKDDEKAIIQRPGKTEFTYRLADQQRLARIVKSNRKANGSVLGRFVGVSGDRKSFEFRPRFGNVVNGKFFHGSIFPTIHEVTRPSDLAPYVELTGALEFDVRDKLVFVGDVSSIRTVARQDDPMGEEIRGLIETPAGWLDGRGAAPSTAAIEWACAFAQACDEASTVFPHLFPTEEGGVLLEDQIGPVRWSLEIEPDGEPFIVVSGGGMTPIAKEPADPAEAAGSLAEFRA